MCNKKDPGMLTVEGSKYAGWSRGSIKEVVGNKARNLGCWLRPKMKDFETKINLNYGSEGLWIRFGRNWWRRKKKKIIKSDIFSQLPDRCIPLHDASSQLNLQGLSLKYNHPNPVSCRGKHNVWIGKLLRVWVFPIIMIHRCLECQHQMFLAFKKKIQRHSRRVISSDISLTYTLVWMISLRTFPKE